MRRANSNTSHVIVYQPFGSRKDYLDTHSNTSHVIVYPAPDIYKYLLIGDSNTSHVIVYLPSTRETRSIFVIQIHLMLLFIGIPSHR